MDSLARPEGAGKAASPTNPHARKIPKDTSYFSLSYKQASIPIPPRGIDPDGEHLTSLEKMLLGAIGFWSWTGEPCWPSYDQLAQAIGLSGKHRGRYVRYLFFGRNVRGKKRPGLKDRGWVEIRPGKDRAQRLIIPTEKWRMGRQLRLFDDVPNGSNLGARAPKFGGRARLSSEPQLRRARPPELDPFPERPKEDSRTFNVVESPGSEIPKLTATAVTELHRLAELPDHPLHALARRELNALVGDHPAAIDPAAPATRGNRPSAIAAAVDQVEQVVAEVLTSGAVPPEEILAEVLGRYAKYPDHAEQARYLVEKIVNQRGVRLLLNPDGTIKPEPGAGVDPLSGEEISVLRWLKPAVVAELRKRQPQSSAESEVNAAVRPGAGSPDKAAPRVKNPAEIRRMIKRLPTGPAADDSDCVELARRLATDPGFSFEDQDPGRSERTYYGLARDTKQRRLAEEILLGAFEESCRAKIRNRGATLVAAVKRLKSEAKARAKG